jgi:hypothetical protein
MIYLLRPFQSVDGSLAAANVLVHLVSQSLKFRHSVSNAATEFGAIFDNGLSGAGHDHAEWALQRLETDKLITQFRGIWLNKHSRWRHDASGLDNVIQKSDVVTRASLAGSIKLRKKLVRRGELFAGGKQLTSRKIELGLFHHALIFDALLRIIFGRLGRHLQILARRCVGDNAAKIVPAAATKTPMNAGCKSPQMNILLIQPTAKTKMTRTTNTVTKNMMCFLIRAICSSATDSPSS